MDFDNRYASAGKGNAGVALGVIGTALGVLNGGLGNIWGNNGRAYGACESNCSENSLVTRYELQQEQALAAKDTEISLLKANTYNDQKMLEMYKYVDGRLREIEGKLSEQSVFNQRTADSFDLVKQDISAESERRCCGDNALLSYMNATFYPKMVADVTTGTATTAQTLYNPLPKCGGNCCNS